MDSPFKNNETEQAGKDIPRCGPACVSDKVAFLKQYPLPFVCTDYYWRPQAGGLVKAPLDEEALRAHTTGQPIAVSLIKAGSSQLRSAVLDFDDHGNPEVGWDRVRAAVKEVIRLLRKHGHYPLPFRSKGGKGIHLWEFFQHFQDAASIRESLSDILTMAGFDEASGVFERRYDDGARLVVEIFPKSPKVERDGYGNPICLPLCGESVLLGRDLNPINECRPAVMYSDPIESEPVEAIAEEQLGSRIPSLTEVEKALSYYKNEDLDYDAWIGVGFSLKNAFGDSAWLLFKKWSASSTKNDPRETEKTWKRMKRRPEGSRRRTIRSIFRAAIAHGYEPPPQLGCAYPQIREMDGRLILVTAGRDGEKVVPITTFLIRPERAIQDPEKGEFLDAKLVSGSVESPVRFGPEVWLSARSFRQALPRAEMTFTGSDADVQRIRYYLSSLPKERVAGVSVAGIHDGKFVVSDGTLGPNGPVYDLVHVGNPVHCGLLIADKPSEADLAAMADILPRLNVPEVVGPILGWAAACFFKPMIMARYSQFPLLSVEGEAGAGKTSTVQHIVMRLWGLSDEPKAIGDLTPFTRMKSVSSSNCIPVIFEENKSHKMSENKQRNISSLIRNTFNGIEGERGRADQTTTRYPHSAPVVIVGETGFCEEAVLDRLVFASMSRRDSSRHSEAFERCRTLPLIGLGRLLLDTALREPGRMNDLIDEEIATVTEALTDRPRFNAAVARAGLRLLEEVSGMAFDLSAVDRAIASGIAPDGGDDSAYRKSAVVFVLEKMSMMAERRGTSSSLFSVNLEHGVHFSVVGSELRIRVSEAYAQLRRWAREYDATADLIDEQTFRKQVIKEPFFKRFAQARVGEDNRRCLLLDLDALSKVANVEGFRQNVTDAQGKDDIPF